MVTAIVSLLGLLAAGFIVSTCVNVLLQLEEGDTDR